MGKSLRQELRQSALSRSTLFVLAVAIGVGVVRFVEVQNALHTACWLVSQWHGDFEGQSSGCSQAAFRFWESRFDAQSIREEPVVERCPEVSRTNLSTEEFEKVTKQRTLPLRFKQGLGFIYGTSTKQVDLATVLESAKAASSIFGWVSSFGENENAPSAIQNVSLAEYVNGATNKTHDQLGLGPRLAVSEADKKIPILGAIASSLETQEWAAKSGQATVSFLVGKVDATKRDARQFHGDIFENVNVQLWGYKKWTLVHPKYMFQFRPQVSGVNIRSPFGESKPTHWKRIPRYECVMEPGDIMYIPTSFIHKVDYIQGDEQQAASHLSASLLYMSADWKRGWGNHWQTAAASAVSYPFLHSELAVIDIKF